MAKPVKKFDVTLSYNNKSGDWGLAQGKGRPVAPEQFPAVTVPYGHSGQITFKIVDSPGVTFAPKDPILAAPVTNPSSKPTALDPQFKIVPSGDPTVLIVDDLNGVPGQPQKKYDKTDFNYVLNFVNAEQVDPIIANSGCCKPTGSSSFLSSTAGVVTIVALTVALIAILVLRMRKTSEPGSGAA